jgi:DNA-binding XRE family transcriptional regulator
MSPVDALSTAVHHVLEARSRWIGPGIPRDLDTAIRELRDASDFSTGADLAAEREAAGLSQPEVGRRMGVGKQAIWKIERQDHPTAETKTRYRAALKGTK